MLHKNIDFLLLVGGRELYFRAASLSALDSTYFHFREVISGKTGHFIQVLRCKLTSISVSLSRGDCLLNLILLSPLVFGAVKRFPSVWTLIVPKYSVVSTSHE